MGIYKIASVNSLSKKKQINKKKTLLSYLSKKYEPNFSNYDADTGDKVAGINMQNNNNFNSLNKVNLRLAKEEILGDAHRNQTAPINWLHALKSGTVGTSGGFVLSQLTKVKGRLGGLMSLGLGTGVALADMKRQLSNYNRQMAARELIAGKRTARSNAYAKYLASKYLNG